MTIQTTTNDIHQQITDRIVKAIEEGASEMRLPWNTEAAQEIPRNVASGKPYRGINILALWVAQLTYGYSSNLWGTYRQWQSIGAHVRRGEKASSIVFYRELRREELNELGEVEEKRSLVARASSVFNADQVEGFKAPEELARIDRTERLAAADALIAATGAEIRHWSGFAGYSREYDAIYLPERERFTGTDTSTATESYYSVAFHELTHWTAAEHRLNRNLTNRFGSDAYAMEELIAELGAAFLSAHVGIASEPRPDHASYIANWLSVLKEDKKAIFTAASKASQAVDFIAALGSTEDDAQETDEQIERAGGAAENLSNQAA